MKKINLFKTLLDILVFIFLIVTITVVIFIIRVGGVSISHINMIGIESWNFFYWFIAIVSLMTYIIFLRGLYFLKKTDESKLFRYAQYHGRKIPRN